MIEGIWNSVTYTRKSEIYLSKLNYLVLQKNYIGKENTLEPSLAIQYFQKLISFFHKNHLKKLLAISSQIDIAPWLAMPTIRFQA